MPELAAVCFDLDGTLCRARQDPDRLLSEAFDAVGVEPLFDTGNLDDVDTAALDTAESDLEFFENFFAAGARLACADPAPGTVDRIAAEYLDRLDQTAVRPRDGAIAALESASEQYPVGLVTNGGEETQTAKLRELGLEDAFDATVFCDPTNGVQPKPDPTPMELALDALGTPADRTLYVGDSLGADVAGAAAAGMPSAWVPPHGPEPDPSPEPTYVLESMDELPELF